MAYWLLKSEPAAYGIRDLARDGTTEWEGVRNYRARNFLRRVRAGDRAFFYHSGVPRPAIAGEMTVTRGPRPDPSQFAGPLRDPASPRSAPRWVSVRVRFGRAYARPIGRDALRRHPVLRRMAVLGHTRLSVTPVTAAEWRAVSALAA